MKWYFAINETGSLGPHGLYARLAIRTARKFTNLRPHMLYFGRPTGFTAWMEQQGVSIIPAKPSYIGAIYDAIAEGRYVRHHIGHWLRTEICNIDISDPFVLYTDVDVAFLKPIDMTAMKPEFFACAPEFEENNWSYFNSGVMLMNLAALRQDYPQFRELIIRRFSEPQSAGLIDQTLYNEFYQNRWDHLDTIFNWKPYWRPNPDTAILHLHGPKLHDIRSIVEGTWNWENSYNRQVGRIFVTHYESYMHNLQRLLTVMDAEDELVADVRYILANGPTVGRYLLDQIQRAEGANAGGAAEGADRVLAELTCQHCGVRVRITDCFQLESHVATGFSYRHHPGDHAAISAACRHPAGCAYQHQSVMAWLLRRDTV